MSCRSSTARTRFDPGPPGRWKRPPALGRGLPEAAGKRRSVEALHFLPKRPGIAPDRIPIDLLHWKRERQSARSDLQQLVKPFERSGNARRVAAAGLREVRLAAARAADLLSHLADQIHGAHPFGGEVGGHRDEQESFAV